MICPYCDGNGVQVYDICTKTTNPTCEGECIGCQERYDTRECECCIGTGEVSLKDLKEFEYDG